MTPIQKKKRSRAIHRVLARIRKGLNLGLGKRRLYRNREELYEERLNKMFTAIERAPPFDWRAAWKEAERARERGSDAPSENPRKLARQKYLKSQSW